MFQMTSVFLLEISIVWGGRVFLHFSTFATPVKEQTLAILQSLIHNRRH